MAEIKGIVQEIRELTNGGSTDVSMDKAKDRLMLVALADIYEKVDACHCELEKIKGLVPWVQVWKWMLLTLGPAFLLGMVAFLWSVLTHDIIITPK